MNIKGMEEYYKDIDKKTWTKIIYSDSSKNNGIKENSIDCIITSPPYGDTAEQLLLMVNFPGSPRNG